MPKPLRVSVIATVSIQMIVTDEDKLTDGVETLEDGIKYALGDELYRQARLGEFSIEAESVDDIQILDHGDFAEELAQCPSCEVYYALKAQVEIIKHKGTCKLCP